MKINNVWVNQSGTQEFYGEGWLKEYGNGNIHLHQRGGIWHLEQSAVDGLNDNDGSIGGTAHWTYGKVGLFDTSFAAFNCDGSNYVNIPDDSDLDIADAVTVEAWIKPSRLNVWQSPLEKGAHNDWSYGFYIEPAGGNIGFEIGKEGSTVTWAGATAPVNSYLSVNKWSHIVGTADSTTGKVCLYIDGKKAGEGTFSGQINTNSLPFQIGKRYDGGYFGGVIDEVRVYDYALTDSQISDHAAVASYHFNGGDYAYDSAPYGNTGTVYGCSWATGLRTSSGYSYGAGFDGSNDYVNVPSSSSLRVTNAITIAAWIKISRKTGDSSDQIIVSKNGYDYILNVYGTGRGSNVGKVEVGGSALSPQWLVGSTVVDDNKWHYIVFTYDGSNKMIYVDGYPNTYPQATSGSFSSTTGALRMGRQPSGDARQVNGVIDEVRIYDRALSSSEISSYYNTNKPVHWLTVSAIWDQYGATMYPWVKIDGQTTNIASVTRGTHTVQVQNPIQDPYLGYFYFDRFTYDSTTNTQNPMTISVSKDTEVIAHYYWGGW